MSNAFTTPTRKVKNVTKMKSEIGKAKKEKHAPKKKYAEGFTPPEPSSEESGSEASLPGAFKTEEDQSDEKERMELEEDSFVRYVDETLRLAYVHPFLPRFKSFCYSSDEKGAELDDR